MEIMLVLSYPAVCAVLYYAFEKLCKLINSQL